MPITDLNSKHANLLRAILGQYFHDMPVSVFLFGSRVGTAYRPDSDLDLLIDAAQDIPLSTRAQLKEAFEESALPFRVDVVFRTDISPDFYQRIQEHLIPLCAFKGHGC
jgi:predicted nucleotidyltransferase